MSYNPGLGKFLSVDPLRREYPWYTPYQFAGNTPIWATDLDGLEPFFTTEAVAARVANDVNAIFFSKYGDEFSKSVVTLNREVTRIKNPNYGFLDKVWKTFGSDNYDPEFIEQERFYLAPSEDFDWNKDRYTQALNDIFGATKPVLVNLVEDTRIAPPTEILPADDLDMQPAREIKRENDRQWKMIWEIGGGSVENFPTVILSDKLLDTPIGEAPSTVDYTIGGVFLHEFIYHLHPISAEKRDQNKPQVMRRYYNIATNNHGMSVDHPIGPRIRLMFNNQELRKIENRIKKQKE